MKTRAQTKKAARRNMRKNRTRQLTCYVCGQRTGNCLACGHTVCPTCEIKVVTALVESRYATDDQLQDIPNGLQNNFLVLNCPLCREINIILA